MGILEDIDKRRVRTTLIARRHFLVAVGTQN